MLAVAVSPRLDRDNDGVPDADNDDDGRINEDPGDDLTFDAAAGLYDIDDDGDGSVDESANAGDDDEQSDGLAGEDPLNGADDDGDGSRDEDLPGDANGDGAPGIAGVDDDGDLLVDEGSVDDDDEDGAVDEDWVDAVVFHLQGGILMERTAVPWDTDGDADVDGRDSVSSILAEGVRRVRFERLPRTGRRAELVDIVLTLAGASGAEVELSTRMRVGGVR